MFFNKKALLCFFSAFSLCSAKSLGAAENAEKTPWELDDYLNGTFSSKSFNGTWLSDTDFLYTNSSGYLLKYNLESKTSEIFLEESVLSNYSGASITLSEDQSYVLISYNVSSVFRHSITAQYTIYDISKQQYYDIANGSALQLSTFATKGHGLVYVLDNDIYYLDDFSVDVENPTRVTNIGVPGIIYCGVPDWVYEEEVLGGGSALWFSPDAENLAFATFVDLNVTDFSYYIYGTPGVTQYPTQTVIKYPKVGTPNPLVVVYVYNFANNTTVEFQLPSSIDNKDKNDYVLYDLTWVSNTELVMMSTNRVQNKGVLIRCTLNGACEEETTYEETKGWLTPLIPLYNNDGTKRLEILPQPEGDDRFQHLVLTDVATNTATRLTNGKKVVTSIYGWDEENNLIYYVGSVSDTPSQRQVYVVSTSGVDRCITCDMQVDGEPCKYASASFSSSLSYYAKICSGPNPVYVVLQKTKDESYSVIWTDNAAVRAKLELKLRPVIKDLRVPVTDEFEARVRLYLPPNLDESGTKKYPAVLYPYAGPDYNQILDSYSSGFLNYLTTNREYIYVLIDGRGSGRDGLNKIFSNYRNLATYEMDDQITATKYLLANLSYIDPEKVGIWGWSYGGFASTWVLIKDTDKIFNFALAVAPITSYIYYDTIYTERYMGLPTPEDNELGYNNTDLSRHAERLKGRNYFIIHGNADDNVHYQNTMSFVKALEQADVQFRQQDYPDENHSLTYVSRHLYHTIDKYWAKCFGLE